MVTQYASGRKTLPFSASNIAVSTGGALGVSGTYYLSINAENRVGFNLNSTLIPITITSTSKITITLPAILASEDWQNIIISASITNDATTLTQIVKVRKSDATTQVVLDSANIFKLTTTQRTVAAPTNLPATPEHGLIRYITSLNFFYEYDRYSTKTVNNTIVLGATIGRWLRIGSASTYQQSTTGAGGCDQDVRTPNLTVNAPSYAVDGSKGEGVIYWIRNNFSQSIPSGTRISGLVRLYEEDRSQLFDSLIVLEIIGYVNLTTGTLDTTVASGEVLYSPNEEVLVLEEDLPVGSAVAVRVSPKFRPEHLDNQVPYLANLEMYLTFAPVTGTYAPGSKAFGNIIYAEYDKFNIVPNIGLSVRRLKGSGLVMNYELIALPEETVGNLQPNTQQFIYFSSNGTTFASSDTSITGAIKRARVGTNNGIGNAYSYGTITLTTTNQLTIAITYPTTVRADYPNVNIAGVAAPINASNIVFYIKRSNNAVLKATRQITPQTVIETFTFSNSDFTAGAIPAVTSDFGLFKPQIAVVGKNNISGAFPSDTYEVFIAFEYIGTCTSIDYSVSELVENSASISDLFESASSWGKSISTIASLRAVPMSRITPFQTRYCYEKNALFQYDPNITTVDDGNLVVRPTNNTTGTGAWIRNNSTTWFYGVGVPSNTLGRNGDLYLNTSNSDVFGRTQTIWTQLTNLRGAPSTLNLGAVTTVNPNVEPTITPSGTATDRIFNFSLPRSPTFSTGTVTGLNAGEVPIVNNVGQNGDIVLNFGIPKGDKGDPNSTIAIGTVTSLAPGSTPTVTNSGSNTAVVLNFGLVRGNTGNPGIDGTNGAAATVSVGTITTLGQGANATVTNSGTNTAAILNFGIPAGSPGTLAANSGITFNYVASSPITTSNQAAVFISNVDNKLKYREENNGSVNTLAVLNKLQQYGAAQVVPTVALTSATNIVADLRASNKFSTILGINATLDASNLQDGTYIFRIRQDATGSRTLVYSSKFKFPGGAAPTLSTAASAVDILSCECDGTNLNCVLTKDFK